MKQRTFTPAVLIGAAFCLGLSLPASAAEKTAPVEPKYDAATVVQISGTVNALREVPKGNPLEGLHLMVQVGLQSLDVYVGPSEFVKMFDFHVAKGDTVQVTGSKVQFEGTTYVLSSELTQGNVILNLRDKNGEPLWKYFLKPPVG